MFYNNVQSNPMCRLSDESHRTDSTDASSLDESDEDYDTCDRNISVLMKSDDTESPFEKLSVIDLESKSFLEGSFTYFRKKLSTTKYPIRVISDLRNITLTQLSDLSVAVHAIDTSNELVELILMNGSNRKFNILFPSLEALYNKHAETGKPITIVYNATSASQMAYKRLYALRGVNNLPHSYLNYIIRLGAALISAIRSPEKTGGLTSSVFPQVIEINEEEYQDSVKIDQAIYALKDVKQLLIIQNTRKSAAVKTDRRELPGICHLFEQLTTE